MVRQFYIVQNALLSFRQKAFLSYKNCLAWILCIYANICTLSSSANDYERNRLSNHFVPVWPAAKRRQIVDTVIFVYVRRDDLLTLALSRDEATSWDINTLLLPTRLRMFCSKTTNSDLSCLSLWTRHKKKKKRHNFSFISPIL